MAIQDQARVPNCNYGKERNSRNAQKYRSSTSLPGVGNISSKQWNLQRILPILNGARIRNTVISFIAIFLVSDLFQWFYHYLSHTIESMWGNHKHHHRYFNPTPFGVLADEPIDHLIRATPMVVIPLIIPCNLDLLFFVYLSFFYIYGILLHWGYEFNFGCASQQNFLFTPYEHNLHHNVSTRNKCYHAGFFLKLWDQLAGTEYRGLCKCAHCSPKAGKRSQQAFNNIIIPDYSVLLSPQFWIHNDVSHSAASQASEKATDESMGWCDSWRDDRKVVLQLRRMSTDTVVSCLNRMQWSIALLHIILSSLNLTESTLKMNW